MTDKKITFNIEYSLNGNAKAKLSENSKLLLSAKEQKDYELLGNVLITTTLETAETMTTTALKKAATSHIAVKAHIFKIQSITFGVDYMTNLNNERLKYGDNGIKDHSVALAQTLMA